MGNTPQDPSGNSRTTVGAHHDQICPGFFCEVDDLHSGMFEVLQALMRRDPDHIERAGHYLSASRDLERIADLATNIAEDVVFMVEGEVIRHQDKEVQAS